MKSQRLEMIFAGIVIAGALIAGLGPAIARSIPSAPDLAVVDAGDEPAPSRAILEPAPAPGEPPSYLRGKAFRASLTGVALLLAGGSWAGHHEPLYRVFDIRDGSERTFRIRLPQDDTLPYVELEGTSGTFPVYDARRHPSSEWSIGTAAETPPELDEPYRCLRCNHDRFHVAAGFEIPSDAEGPDDVTWVAIAIRCAHCDWQTLVYGHETG